jgi:predicted transcriptional regulator
MEPLKKEAMDIISRLPDDTDIDEIMYRLYVLDKVRKGQEDVQNGRVTTTEDLVREIEKW